MASPSSSQVQKIMFQRHGVQSMSVCRKELLDMLHDRPWAVAPDVGDLGRHANLNVVECFYIGELMDFLMGFYGGLMGSNGIYPLVN